MQELVYDALLSPFMRLVDGSHVLWLPVLGAALVLAGCMYVLTPSLQSRHGSLLNYLFPRSTVLARSARNDLLYFFVNGVVLYLLVHLLLFDSGQIGAAISRLAGDWIPEPIWGPPGIVGRVLITLGAMIVKDFCIFFTHYCFHRLRFLWEFHKLHHSPEVLIPFTLLRLHPVEGLAYAAVIASLLGIYSAACTLLFGPYEALILGGVIGVLNLAFAVVYTLHHTHFYLTFPSPMRYLLYSPAHHHIHHSSAPEHFDKNFGVMFVWWDYLFGCHFAPPDEQPELVLGVFAEPDLHQNLWQMYAHPVVGALRVLAGRKTTKLPSDNDIER